MGTLGTDKLLALRAGVALVCAVFLITTSTADAQSQTEQTVADGRPDLVVSRERLRSSINLRSRTAHQGDCTIVEGCLGDLGKRRTIEFDTYVINAGTGDLHLGNPADNPDLFEYSPCHMHYHLKNSFVYEISHGGSDTVGLFDPGTRSVMYRNANTAGPADGSYVFEAGATGSLPIAGDWNMNGASRPGLYDPATGQFTLLESGPDGPTVFTYRPEENSLTPVAGDWDGDGRDTVGLYSSTTHTFYLKRKNSKGRKADTFVLDPGPGDWTPIAGDWDGDDVDTVGLFDRATGTVVLKNANTTGSADASFVFGAPGNVAVAGDWNQDGVDTIGAFDAATGKFSLRNANTAGEPDLVFTLDSTGGAKPVPVVGDWDYNTGTEVVPGHKDAFCWLDTQRIIGDRGSQFRDCNVNQGLTAGWCDIYIRNTDCQWIDITGLAAGTYQLTVTVNGQGQIADSDLTNNTASVKVRIPAPKAALAAPKVSVTAPKPSEAFTIGQPVKIRWSVSGGRHATHQEIWLADVSDDHPSKVMLIDGAVAPGARSYTWIPTAENELGAAQIMVRVQDDGNFVGTDSRSQGVFRIQR